MKGWEGTARRRRRFFQLSFRSLIETATFFYNRRPCPPRGFSDEEHHGDDIRREGQAERKRGDVGKRSWVRQTETNTRKQGPKRLEEYEGWLAKRLRTYREPSSSPLTVYIRTGCLGLISFPFDKSEIEWLTFSSEISFRVAHFSSQ